MMTPRRTCAALKVEWGRYLLTLLVCALGFRAPAQAQNPTVRTIVYDATDVNGSFQIYLKNLDINNTLVGAPVQVTNNGTTTQPSQEPQYSLVASANATVNPDYLGRIVYQHGASGVRGLHLIKPDGTGDVQLTPLPSTGYPCIDARDPSWSPDGLHIIYACLEPLLSGIGSSYDLWIHDTNGTPDNPNDDADYPLLRLNGLLALQPAWSPDGTMIAYMTNAPGGASAAPTPKIALLNVPAQLGTVLYSGTVLTSDAYNDIEPAWDPSSSFIAFATNRQAVSGGAYTNGSHRTIWTITTAGQIVAQITGTSASSANDTHPSWPSPDVMYFQSDRSNGNNGWLINPTIPENFGGSALQITGAPGDASGDGEPGIPILGIDISNDANLITNWDQY
jgi:hypothetical protein